MVQRRGGTSTPQTDRLRYRWVGKLATVERTKTLGRNAMALDGLLLSRVLLTLVTIGYALVTVKADFNKTHATNPLWIGRSQAMWASVYWLWHSFGCLSRLPWNVSIWPAPSPDSVWSILHRA